MVAPRVQFADGRDSSDRAATSVRLCSPHGRGAVIQILIGLGFGGPLWAVLHLAQHGEPPMTPWGFVRWPVRSRTSVKGRSSVLAIALAVVCAVDIAAGVRLWRLQRRGLRLGLVTALPQLALGLGFALPFQLVSVPLRVGLAFAGRRSLR